MLRFHTDAGYIQTAPDGKFLCPDRPERKVPLSRSPQSESANVQTTVRYKTFFAFFVIAPRASQIKSVYIQIIVRSKSNLYVPTPIFWFFRVQTIVHSCPDFRVFTRPRKQITSCGARLFLEDEGGRGFKKLIIFIGCSAGCSNWTKFSLIIIDLKLSFNKSEPQHL